MTHRLSANDETDEGKSCGLSSNADLLMKFRKSRQDKQRARVASVRRTRTETEKKGGLH